MFLSSESLAASVKTINPYQLNTSNFHMLEGEASKGTDMS